MKRVPPSFQHLSHIQQRGDFNSPSKNVTFYPEKGKKFNQNKTLTITLTQWRINSVQCILFKAGLAMFLCDLTAGSRFRLNL